MKDLSLIACVSSDGGLGWDNDLLWHLKADMRFFRQTTRGATVVMGSRTYASLGRPLPERHNVVLSRGDVAGDVTTLHSEAELRSYLANLDDKIFIIGGASLYQMFLNDATKIYLTEVQATKPADTYFPQFDHHKYTRKVLAEHLENGISFQIVEYARKEFA